MHFDSLLKKVINQDVLGSPNPSSNGLSSDQISSLSSQENSSDMLDKEGIDFNEQTTIDYLTKERKEKNEDKKKCHKFQPFCEYFMGQKYSQIGSKMPKNPKFLYLLKSESYYDPRQSKKQAYNLSTSKQIQFIRGSLKEHLDEQFLKKLVEEQKMSCAPIHQIGQRSFITNQNQLIYGMKNKLKSFLLYSGEDLRRTYVKDAPKSLFEFPQDILQIAKLNNDLWVVRTRLAIYLYSVKSTQKIIDKFVLEAFNGNKQMHANYEITCMEAFLSDRDINIKIGVYNILQKTCLLYEWTIQMNKIKKYLSSDKKANELLSKKKLLVKISHSPNYLISVHTLNLREVCLCFHHKLAIFDIKINAITEQVVSQNDYTGFIYATVLIRNTEISSPYLIFTDARFLSILDLSSLEIIRRFSHHSEQDPPTILHLSQQAHPYPTIIAYNPKRGALIFDLMSLFSDNKKLANNPLFRDKRKEFYSNVGMSNFFSNSLQALQSISNPLRLFSSNLINSGIGLLSISATKIKDKMKVIQIDQREGISEEMLGRSQFTNKIERMDYNGQSIDLGVDWEVKWVQKKIKQIYLCDQEQEKGQIEQEQIEDDENLSKQIQMYLGEGEKVESNKLNYMTLTNFQKKIKTLSQKGPKLSSNQKQVNTFPETFSCSFSYPEQFAPNFIKNNAKVPEKSKESVLSEKLIERLQKEWGQL